MGGDRPEPDALPQPEDQSTDREIAESRRRKTPLVLPYEGERRKGRCFAQLPELSSLPRRERQKGSSSQGVVGHPVERDRESPATRRMCLCAKRGAVQGLRPAMDPSTALRRAVRAPAQIPMRPRPRSVFFSRSIWSPTWSRLPWGDSCDGGLPASGTWLYRTPDHTSKRVRHMSGARRRFGGCVAVKIEVVEFPELLPDVRQPRLGAQRLPGDALEELHRRALAAMTMHVPAQPVE